MNSRTRHYLGIVLAPLGLGLNRIPQVDVDIGVGIKTEDPVHITGVEPLLKFVRHIAKKLLVLCHAAPPCPLAIIIETAIGYCQGAASRRRAAATTLQIRNYRLRELARLRATALVRR